MIAGSRFSNALRYRDEADPRQVRLTPDYILDPVRDMFGGTIGLDPCTEADNPTGADHFYCPPTDGATLPWDAETIFVNPPYGKARVGSVDAPPDPSLTGAEVVLLMPAHPDTRIFHEALETAAFVVFIQGRVKFGVLRPNRRQAAASHPSALIVWGRTDIGELRHLGTVVVPSWSRAFAARLSAHQEEGE